MVPRPLPRHGVSPLLSTIGGKPRDESAKPAKPVREPEDVYAPPLESSDDEVEEPPTQDPFVDSSDDEHYARKADIVPTKFISTKASNDKVASNGRQTSAKGKEPASESLDSTPKRRSVRQPSTASMTKKRSLEDIQDDEPGDRSGHASYKKAKTPAKSSLSSVGAHMQPGWHLESSIERKAKTQKAGYGKKAGKVRNSLSSTDKFRTHLLSSESPEKPAKFKTLDFDTEEVSPVRNQKSTKSSAKKTKNKKGSKFSELEAEETPEKPQLKLLGGDDHKPRRNLRNLDLSIAETPVDNKRELEPGQTHCPMCDEPVDEESLKDFSKGQRMTVARQNKFCLTHRKKSAQETWEDKGYPDIDWSTLDKRAAYHHDYIESLIRGASSHFGTLLQEKIDTGKNRTIFKTTQYAMPGYYGLRGMSLLTEAIVETFSSLIRERAPKDKLISARGYTTYVQSVLVPELAVKLIQEDMGNTSAEEARGIMERSRDVGEILNDEKPEPQKRIVETRKQKEKDVTKKSSGKTSTNPKIQNVSESESELSSLDSPSMVDDEENAVTEAVVATSETQVVQGEGSDSDLSSVENF